MEKGGGLTYSMAVTILTCAFSLLSVHHALAIPEDFNIRQVIDEENPTINHHLLGTAAEHRFKSFIQEYSKEYTTREEYIHRLGIFAKNLLRAAEHQALDPTAIHGVNQFTDLTSEEFERMYMGVKGGDRSTLLGQIGSRGPPLEVKGLPERFDWREKGAVTDVKMQGTCGSCWAFSTTGSIEGANFIATGKLLNLSEQQLVDCDHTCDKKDKKACDSGCSGGLMTNAYKYLIEAGGIQEEDSYPYTGKRGECKFQPDKVAVKVSNFTNIPIDEQQIASYLVNHGPLAVGLNAVFMQTYIGDGRLLQCGGVVELGHFCEVPFCIEKGQQLLFRLREGNDFSVPRAMEVDTGNSCFIEKLPVERFTSTRETKKSPPENNKSPLVFVNHVYGAAAIAWHENRRRWVGDVSRRSDRMPKDPIISWSTTYEDLLSTTEPFSEPIPLTEMVDFLVDIWHDEGLFD
ncbi:hypothetical protein K7X08_003163 [Anisodus acutangulus]|uniref:Cysteine proteinase n=1 Tax=Anisodus acutangulus TaxID=402998 RepID=A0A9Q1MGJ4_9SOLA|nr:hypothetical protein K7X08_003163 [Anisodus acutangulus]